jgi:hypothetical protein
MGIRSDKELHVTLIDGIRRAAIGIGALGLVGATSSAVLADDHHRPPAVGHASEDGTEVQMLTGPTCTWDAPSEDDRGRRYGNRKNVSCDSDDKTWWHGAPEIASGPTGELVLRWATDAQPLRLDTRVSAAKGTEAADLPFSVTASGAWSDGCSEVKNPCRMQHAEASTSGAVTYVVEAFWGETSSTKYAVTLRS